MYGLGIKDFAYLPPPKKKHKLKNRALKHCFVAVLVM